MMEKALAHLVEKGFHPKVILDIGAAKGLWSLGAKEHFKEAEFFMIDPLLESESSLKKVCDEDPRCHYLLMALGEKPGSFPIHVHPDCDGSTLLCWPGADPRTLRTIRVATADELIGERAIKPPDLVKIDVQGFELKVLRGGGKLFESAEVFIIEVNLFRFHPEMPLVHEVVAYMAERGFPVFDLAGMLRRPYQNDLGQMDLVFVSSGSPMTSSSRWE